MAVSGYLSVSIAIVSLEYLHLQVSGGSQKKVLASINNQTTRSIMRMRISFDKNKLTGVGTRTCVWWSRLEERVPVRQTTSLSPASVIHSLNLTTHNLFVSTVYRDCRSVSRHSGRFYFTVFTKSIKTILRFTKHQTPHYLSCCYNSK